jgi:uncharacterized Tic20 family protein
LIGFFALIAVLPARGQAPVPQAPIEIGQAQSPTAQTPESQAGDKLTLNKLTLNRLVGRIGGILGGIILLVLIGSLIAWQWRKAPQAKDDDKALEELRIVYGFWLIIAVLLIAFLVFVVTLTVIPPDTTTRASDIVAIAGTVTGLITTLTAAFFGIQQAGAGRSQALSALAQSTRADGAAVGKLDPSYGPHSGGTNH